MVARIDADDFPPAAARVLSTLTTPITVCVLFFFLVLVVDRHCIQRLVHHSPTSEPLWLCPSTQMDEFHM